MIIQDAQKEGKGKDSPLTVYITSGLIFNNKRAVRIKQHKKRNTGIQHSLGRPWLRNTIPSVCAVMYFAKA